MQIYVAGPGKSINACLNAMQIVRDLGHTVTVDWTKDYDELDFDPFVIANRDEEGIKCADLMVLIYTVHNSTGSMVELGYARALKRPVIIRSYVGRVQKHRVFMHGYLEHGEKRPFPVVHSDEELRIMLEHYKNKFRYEYNVDRPYPFP